MLKIGLNSYSFCQILVLVQKKFMPMNMIAYIFKRFSERETWIALSTFMGGASYYFTSDQWDDVIALGMAASSLAYALFPKSAKVRIVDENSNSITTAPFPQTPKEPEILQQIDKTPSVEEVVSNVAAVATAFTPAPEILAIANALHALINSSNDKPNANTVQQ